MDVLHVIIQVKLYNKIVTLQFQLILLQLKKVNGIYTKCIAINAEI